jgi:hypothetical protein
MFSEETARQLLSLIIVGGFFGLLGIILFGFVDVQDPAMAKLVGVITGVLGAKLDVVLYRYFGLVVRKKEEEGSDA